MALVAVSEYAVPPVYQELESEGSDVAELNDVKASLNTWTKRLDKLGGEFSSMKRQQVKLCMQREERGQRCAPLLHNCKFFGLHHSRDMCNLLGYISRGTWPHSAKSFLLALRFEIPSAFFRRDP